MEYLDINQTAAELKIQPQTVAALCKGGFFGRKVGNTWCITDKEIEYHLAGHRFPPEDLPPVYDSQQVMAILGISRTQFYRLIRCGQIVGERFGHRGGQHNWLFTEAQLAGARTAVQDIAKNGYMIVPADKYITERDGRFHINGTEQHYKSRTIARTRARKVWKHALGMKIEV